jgi:hypothetical protein
MNPGPPIKSISLNTSLPHFPNCLRSIRARSLFLFLLFAFSAFQIHAQQKNLPLNYDGFQNSDEFILRDTIPGHLVFTAMKPMLESRPLDQDRYEYNNSNAYIKVRQGRLPRSSGYTSDSLAFLQKPHYSGWKQKLVRKVVSDHLITITDSADRFHVTIDPLLNLQQGQDIAAVYNHQLKVNTRGILIRGDIGTKFSFETSDYENQSWQPYYIDSFARASQVIPGQGRWKDFKKGGFDYSMSSGYISYSPNKHFNLQGGTGKHFIGDGYRSLLLSDNAFNYPYLRITTTFGIFQYTNLYASLMNLTFSKANIPVGTEHLYEKKSANFQFLSIHIHPRIELGLFQALIAQAADSTNRQHLDFYYFQPVIGVSALKYGLNDPNHVLLGSTLKIKVCRFFYLYGQYMLDGVPISGPGGSIYNRQGFQAGAKFFDFCKIPNLDIQTEYNQVRPFAYSSSESSQSYTHYGQPLADPLGANFRESILIVHYRINGFFIQLKYIHANIGADSLGKNYGQNVFNSDYTAYVGTTPNSTPMLQGVKSTLDSYDLKLGYLINPSYNLNLVVGMMMRDYRNSTTNAKTDYIYLGLQTSLSNIYYDF